MIKKYIDTGRGRVYYWLNQPAVYKTTLMLTHGLTADHSLFDLQLDALNDIRIITWDMPLHGESRPYNDFSFIHAAQDMKQILDQEGIDSLVMAGQSAGGYAVQVFAHLYPHLLKGFIAIDSTPLGSHYYKRSETFWTDHYDAFAALLPYRCYCRLSANNAALHKAAREAFYESLLRLGKADMLKAVRSVYRDFKKYDEVKFQCPVLLCLGDHDQVGYVPKYNQMWSQATGYQLCIIPDAGHNSNYDNAPYFNEVIIKFINQLTAGQEKGEGYGN